MKIISTDATARFTVKEFKVGQPEVNFSFNCFSIPVYVVGVFEEDVSGFSESLTFKESYFFDCGVDIKGKYVDINANRLEESRKLAKTAMLKMLANFCNTKLIKADDTTTEDATGETETPPKKQKPAAKKKPVEVEPEEDEDDEDEGHEVAYYKAGDEDMKSAIMGVLVELAGSVKELKAVPGISEVILAIRKALTSYKGPFFVDGEITKAAVLLIKRTYKAQVG